MDNDEFNRDSLDRLNYLLTESVKHVDLLIKKLGNLVSERERKSKIETGKVINGYGEKYNKFNEKFHYLKVKLSRQYCEIFLFGKVSTGKSKIINAILRKDIFQSASAHTTSCFVKICKSSDQYHHIEYRDEKASYIQLNDLKNKINELSTTVSDGNLETKELLSVYLNISNNKIFTSKTKIIDCPGTDNKEMITNDIREKGLEANIFIFVLTTDITENEKKFFQYQWDNSSKPIIFFLVNKWDQAYNEGDEAAEDSKRAINNGLIEFLTNKIRLSDDDIENRIFFVSALNICRKRNNINGNLMVNDDHSEENCREFERFEKSLSDFIDIFMNEKCKYENEIIELNEEITRNTEQFQIDFRDKLYIENIPELDKFVKDIQLFSQQKLKEIDSIKVKILNNESRLKLFISENKINLEKYKITSVEKTLKGLLAEIESSIYKLKNELEDSIFLEIDKYKKLTYVELEKEKFKLTEMMEKEIKLTHVSTWERLQNEFIDIFTKIINLFEIGPNKNKREVDKLLEKNTDILNSAIDMFVKDITNNFDSLTGFLNAEIGKIIGQLQIKMKCYKEFSENMKNLLE